MVVRQKSHFLLGMVSGISLVLLCAVAMGFITHGLTPIPDTSVVTAQVEQLWRAIHLNLHGSAPLFLLVLMCFGVQLVRLHTLLAGTGTSMARIFRHEQLMDLCANLFFGIGVIWTAIGMRDALLFALGDVGAATDQGAFSVLQRLVDGGILLALSTTIVGGIGGYLMRAVKLVLLGQRLAFVYLRAQTGQADEELAALQRIEHLLHRATDPANKAPGVV